MEKIWKKGCYIVLIKPAYKGNFFSSSYKEDFIYKQRDDRNYLRTLYDSSGSCKNGQPGYSATNNWNWRFATEQESAAYDIAGKPIKASDVIVSVDTFSII